MSKARQITAMLKLAKALTVPNDEPYTIRSPKDVYSLLAPELSYLTKEHFICLFLNTKNRLITKEVISIGSLTQQSFILEKYFAPESDVVAPLSYTITIIPAGTRLHSLKMCF